MNSCRPLRDASPTHVFSSVYGCTESFKYPRSPSHVTLLYAAPSESMDAPAESTRPWNTASPVLTSIHSIPVANSTSASYPGFPGKIVNVMESVAFTSLAIWQSATCA